MCWKLCPFFKGVGSWAVVFIFLFLLIVCPCNLCCLSSIIFSVSSFKKKSCTITKPISGQFKRVLFRVFVRVCQVLSFLWRESWGFFFFSLEVGLLIIKVFFCFHHVFSCFCYFCDTDLWWWLCKWISLILLRGNLDHCGSRNITNKKVFKIKEFKSPLKLRTWSLVF